MKRIQRIKHHLNKDKSVKVFYPDSFVGNKEIVLLSYTPQFFYSCNSRIPHSSIELAKNVILMK